MSEQSPRGGARRCPVGTHRHTGGEFLCREQARVPQACNRRVQLGQSGQQQSGRGMVARLAQRDLGQALSLGDLHVEMHHRLLAHRSAQGHPLAGWRFGRRVERDQQHRGGAPLPPGRPCGPQVADRRLASCGDDRDLQSAGRWLYEQVRGHERKGVAWRCMPCLWIAIDQKVVHAAAHRSFRLAKTAWPCRRRCIGSRRRGLRLCAGRCEEMQWVRSQQ